MISVLSLLQRLSGSKICLIGLLLFSISCGTSKKTPLKKRTTTTRTTRPKKPTTTRPKVVKKDDREWADSEVDKKKEEAAAKDQEVDEFSEQKSVYNVALFIPFDSKSSSSELSGVSKKFVNYYAGVQLALRKLESEGLALNVKVFDSKSDFDKKLKDPFNKLADVIIGPYDKTNLKAVAAFGKANKIPVVSPWNASKKITEQNPYYIQLNPPATDHYKKITDHIGANFSPDQVFLLQRENGKDDKLNKYIQRYHNSRKGGAPFNEYSLNEDSLQIGDHAYDSLFLINRPTVFVIPNYSSTDENYIYNAVRRISTEKEDKQVFIYGMPILMNSSRFTYDYYKNLGMRTCLAKLTDHNDVATKDFESTYLQAYNALPDDDALEGYDMMSFVGTGLLEHGTKFFRKMVGEKFDGLQSIYDLRAMKPAKSMSLEKEPQVEYYQNKHLDIIQYRGNGFERIR